MRERFRVPSISAPFPPTPQVPASPTLPVPCNGNISQLSAYFFPVSPQGVSDPYIFP